MNDEALNHMIGQMRGVVAVLTLDQLDRTSLIKLIEGWIKKLSTERDHR